MYNRKFLEKDLKRLFQRSLRNTRYGVLMIDIDYFKKFNDFYGHAMGDMVIKEVAASLRSVVRDGDLVIRYGGEEFLVLLKDANHNAVHKVCERMQREIAKKQIRHELSETGAYVSVSIGAVTGLVKDYQSLREYIKRADACMYESKQKGRNCFTVSTETEQ